jgi:surfactin synthase thioesterase subunit
VPALRGGFLRAGNPDPDASTPTSPTPEMIRNPWFLRLAPRPEAPVRLFCFHHAGGSAAMFRGWPARLPEFDVCAVQLPGRGSRMAEPALQTVPAMVDALVPTLLPLLDRPYLLFGHSMGSAVAMGVAQRLHADGAPLPQHLFVSGRQPPHRPFPEGTLRGLTDAMVVEQINTRYGGFPPEALAHPEFIALLLPTLRADFAALDDYDPMLDAPLPLPITAIGGLGDACAAPERLRAWQVYTTHPLRMRHLPGGHFYLEERIDELAALLRETLAQPPVTLPARDAA